MIKVLFVCLGNICRSPLAEGIFNAKVKSMGLEKHLQSDSAGTSDYHIGELPDERTLRCAKEKGIPIQHRGRQVHRTDFRDFTYIVAMDEHNLKNLNQLKKKLPTQPRKFTSCATLSLGVWVSLYQTPIMEVKRNLRKYTVF